MPEPLTIPYNMFPGIEMNHMVGNHITSRHREALRFKNQIDDYETRVANILDMDQREVSYYFECMRNSEIEGTHYNLIKNMMLNAKMVWGEEYNEKLNEEKRRRCAQEEQLRQRQDDIERIKNEVIAWDIQADKVLERLQTQGSSYVPLTTYERWVWNTLINNDVIGKKGLFKKQWQVKRSHDRKHWPLPNMLMAECRWHMMYQNRRPLDD